jgi:tRNA pseudouridine38-40 synthase
MNAHYQVILAYDGTHFAGFQRTVKRRTVQGVVEEALRRIGWDEHSLLAAGRTDTGVHAAGQVIAFSLDWAHSLDDLRNALNANLPPDVSARSVALASPGFHPRFEALSRRYRYFLACQPVRDPLLERYAWRVWPPLELSRLQETAGCFLGTHDFAAYGKAPRLGGSTVRTVTRSTWFEDGERWVFEVAANAFLYHMVRRMVFLQVAFARGKLSLTDFQDSLKGKTEGAASMAGIAPACGLVLVEVEYPPEANNRVG